MSRKERDRLKAIEQLEQGVIDQRRAAAWLKLSERQVRRLWRAYQQRGDAALVHKGRGKPSNRRIEEATVARAKELLRTRYRDFGPTLACEHLASDDAIAVSRETVRQWMRQAGLWGAQRKKRPHRRRRARRPCFGELVQMDTSIHDWLEGRGPALALVTMIDDATGRKLARFVEADTTQANMTLLQTWTQRHGRPLALYTDWATHFRQVSVAGQKTAKTQIERALCELDIELICAHSPQAKGRVERSHGIDQDRLVKELRLLGIATLEAANRFLEQIYLPRVNERFAVEPESAVDAHRSSEGFDLAAIFSVQEERRVANDYTVQVDGRTLQIERGEITGGLRQGKVVIERRLDGTLRLRWGDRYLRYAQAPDGRKLKSVEGVTPPGTPAGVGAAALGAGSLRSPALRSAAPTPANHNPKPKRIPSADHPWRKRTILPCRK